MNRKILLIAFDFPPRRTSGVYRPVAFVRHLAKFGWQPTVLTINATRGDPHDLGLLERVPPQVRVVRTPYFRVNAWEDLGARAVRFVRANRDNGGSAQIADSARREQPSILFRGLSWFARLVRTFFYFPDDTVGWVPSGLLAAMDLFFKERFDVVYTTSPPRSIPLIGLLLKLFLGVTWVAESRDPWLVPADNRRVQYGQEDVLPGVRQKLARWVDALIAHSADLLVTVTEGYAEDLRARHKLDGHKVACISNGFDEGDFPSQECGHTGILDPGFVHLSHIGTIYPQGSGSFFQALAELVREQPEVKQRLRINIIGYPDQEVLEHAADENLRDMIRVQRFVQHHEALRLMSASHCLLVFFANSFHSRFCVPGKMYEYLRTGRPILAISFPGEVQDLIQRSEGGWAIHPNDIPGIKQALRTLLGLASSGGSFPAPRSEYVAQFGYERLTAKLAGALEGVVRHV